MKDYYAQEVADEDTIYLGQHPDIEAAVLNLRRRFKRDRGTGTVLQVMFCVGCAVSDDWYDRRTEYQSLREHHPLLACQMSDPDDELEETTVVIPISVNE